MRWTATLCLGGALLSYLSTASVRHASGDCLDESVPNTAAKVLVTARGNLTLNGTVVPVEKTGRGTRRSHAAPDGGLLLPRKGER